MSVLSNYLWVVSLLLVLWGQQAQSSFSINSFPNPLVFTSDSSFSIHCDYDSSTYEYFEWRHPHVGSIASSFSRFEIINAGNVLTLTVQQTGSMDNGDYHCIFRQRSRPDETRTLSLTAVYFDQPVISTTNGVVKRVSDSQSVTFYCRAMHSTSLLWYDPSTNVISNSSDDRIQVFSDRLVISNVQVSDNGTYHCQASNPVGTAIITACLSVTLPLSTSINPSEEIAMDGDSVTFTCTVKGFPRPNSIWFGVNRPGVTEQIQVLNSSLYYHRLVVTSVNANNTGTYSCQATNAHGNRDTSTATLEILTEFFVGPPEDVNVTLVGTNINITWNPPSGASTIDSYTITWQALNSSTGDNTPISYFTNSPDRRSYLITGLERLTQYSVVVYATRNNRNGRGENSLRKNFTTPASVPDTPLSIRLLDIGPNSVKIEFTLASDDGGSEVTAIRISARTQTESWNEITPQDKPYERGSPRTVVNSLASGNQYQLRIRAVNAIGASPPLDSELFNTPPSGFPGTPSNVTATNITSNSAVICWVSSEVGRPFTSLKVEARDVESTGVESRVWRMSASSDRVKHQEGCSEGFQIMDLEAAKCYAFKVSVTNSQGTGHPSAESEPVCIHPCVDDNCITCVDGVCGPGGSGLFSPSSGLSTLHIVIIAVGCVSLLLLVGLAVFLLWCCCASLRHRKMVKFPTGDPPSTTLRRESSRSNKGLMEYHNETRNGSFQKQSSIGNSSVLTISSQSSETGDFQETPNTATSMISNDQVFFTQNPAAAGSAVPPPKLVTSHPASVPVLLTQSSSTDYPQSNGRINHSGSATFGLTLNGSAFPIYPIPEHPNQSVGSHTFPNHTAHKNHHYPSSTVGELGSPQEQEFEMTENPLNASFEQEKIAEFSTNAPNYSFEVEEPEDEIPPPLPPSYHGGDDLSEIESEMSISTLPLSTPYFGESYSQPSNSPQLSGVKNRGHLCYGAGGAPNMHGSLSGMKNSDTARFNVSASDDEEDLEFCDNNAYQTIAVPGRGTGDSNRCPPPHMVNGYTYRNLSSSDNDDENSKPRFAIRSQERGAVFETVEFRH